MDEQAAAALPPQAPMVLRKMPLERHHLARTLTVPGVDTAGGTWWELVDVAASPDLQPAGVALTHLGADGSVTVSALGIGHAEAINGYADLLRTLVTTLRSGSTDTVLLDGPDGTLVRALLAVGFTRVPDSDRYMITL